MPTGKSLSGLENLRESQLTPQFRTAMTNLNDGATTKPIKLSYDFQIIRLLERRSAGMVSMYEVRATIVKACLPVATKSIKPI